ncbi:hypothetical protein COY95_01470, partial [Candidatus Woesearchaeota archaeon CG_4_10_14_0_8_um_filter_47_5]
MDVFAKTGLNWAHGRKMILKIKDMDIATGGPRIAILNISDLERFDLHVGDRIGIICNKKKATAILDAAVSKKAVAPGRIGMFEELLGELGARNLDEVLIVPEDKPLSLKYIKKKLRGERLNQEELFSIVKDIVDNKLSDIELTYFVSA